ncbi:MAG: 8-oxo-dGTP diphosphatase MutT [Deltaproteobacteria bacterium]|nr:8-oxo-dGTP diphosphatase MutT [Deltaproteobacteria bacterium]
MNNKPHISVTAGLIFKDGRILIAERPRGYHLAGLWEFPGGKQEPDETLEECLEREIKEELGIEIKAERLFATVIHEYEKKIVSLHVFDCTHVNGDPKGLEGQDLKWIKPSELMQYEFPPPDQEVIRLLVKRLKIMAHQYRENLVSGVR